jgi:hypothetical protein
MPAFDFALPSPAAEMSWRRCARIATAHRTDERDAVMALIAEARLAPEQLARAQALATTLATAVPNARTRAGWTR